MKKLKDIEEKAQTIDYDMKNAEISFVFTHSSLQHIAVYKTK